MIDYIDKIIIYLSENNEDSNLAQKIESNLIGRYASKMKWNLLTFEEKQKERKTILRSIKKYKEEDGISNFAYENAVIGFYDAGLELLKNIASETKSEILLLRLSVLVKVDMDSIDVDSKLQNKKIAPLLVYNNLCKELMKAGCYPKGLDELIENVKVLNPIMEIPIGN